MNFYQLNFKEVESTLSTSLTKGLDESAVKKRLSQYGHNELISSNQRSALSIFFEQFKNLLVVLLIVAGILSLYLGSYRDAVVLFTIVLLNSVIGFYQDWKSENLLSTLSTYIKEHCIVVRNGIKKEVPVSLLVKGDLVILKEGDGVPADIRLIESTGFHTNEFILTGESQPSEKNALINIEEETYVADRLNCVFMGTTVAKGEALGVVYATGMDTELGKIAKKSGEIKQDITPLQKEMNQLAFKITIATIVLAVLLFVVKCLLHEPISEAIIFSIGVAAAMVPSGLPAQITIALSIGVQHLAKQNSIIRKLSSVEALGAATVIASDKTGTMTKNEMTITNCYFEGEEYIVTGYGFEPVGEIKDENDNKLTKEVLGDKKIFFISGYLASTSKVNPPDEFHKFWYLIGDPTECAFATLAMKAGYNPEELDESYKKIQLFPFDSHRKRISIIREHKGRYISFVKGSIESLLEVSTYANCKGVTNRLTFSDKEHLLELATSYASKGLRVIAVAYKDLQPSKEFYTAEDAESDLIFSGFVCMMDPPREELEEAINDSFSANIRIFMVTGDNEITAKSIANKIGLKNEDGSTPVVINDKQLNEVNEEDLIKLLKEQKCMIFSRVSPEDKLHIIKLLKKNGEVVAVTGDGVNDTLSLKQADIGVAMGLRGSKVAQEASAMVLLDDNFSTIVYAIKEGRTIYKNIQKNVMATLASNIAELICILAGFISVVYKYPPVILPIQVLLIDLVAENIPLLALSFDPPAKNVMKEFPRKQGQMVNSEVLIPVLFSGILRGIIAILAFLMVYLTNANSPIRQELAMTTTFITLIFTQFANIFTIRTGKSIFNSYTFSNKYLWGGIIVSIIVMVFITYNSFLNEFLHTGPLSMNNLLYPLMGTLLYLLIYESVKFIKRKTLGEK